MNTVWRPFIRKFMVVYVDDILVYSQGEVSHPEHLTQVFQVLREQALYAKFEKVWALYFSSYFPCYVVFGEGIQVDESEIKAIKSWSILTIITKVRSFYWMAPLYRQFIKDFSSSMPPLTECMKKGSFYCQGGSLRNLSQLLWRQQDLWDNKGALLLAQNGWGCPQGNLKVCYMSYAQESLSRRPLHCSSSSFNALGWY